MEADGLTRRGLLARGAAGAGAMTLLGGSVARASRLLATGVAGTAELASTGVLTAAEMGTLEAALAQLLPEDELGPGAVEAGVPTYIDRALAGSYAPLLPVYQGLLEMFDTAAQSMGGASFAALSATEQVALLSDFEAGTPPGVPAADATAVAGEFQLLLEHMREGMFGDPMYGGNANLVGWELIGYPDIQLLTTAHDQQVNVAVAPSHKTAETFGGTPYNGPPV